MKKKILFVINTLGGAGAEMALLELLEKLEKENEKTKDVQYEISLYVLMGQGELVKKLPKEVLLKNKSYQPLSVLQKEGRHFMYRTILKTMFVRGTGIPSAAISFVITCGYVKTAEGAAG